MGLENLNSISSAISAFSSVAAPIAGFITQQRAADDALKAARDEARLMREDAAYRAQQVKKDARRLRSTQMAAYLKSGVTLEGSPLLVTSQTMSEAEKNAQNINTNAKYQADALIKKAKTVDSGDIFGTVQQSLSGVKKGIELFM